MNRPAEPPAQLNPQLHDQIDHNPSGNPCFTAVLDARPSRRSMLRGGMGSAATAVLGSWSLAACGGGDDDPPMHWETR